MASKYWLKLYHETIYDPKVMMMSPSARLRFYECLCLAGDYDRDGELPTIKQMAFVFRISEDQLVDELNELINNGIITENSNLYVIRKFGERQEPIPGAERARLSRKAKNTFRRNENAKDISYDDICKDIDKKPGVYFISFPGEEDAYIGASKNINHRLKVHFTEMKNSSHPLYECLTSHGYEKIIVKALEYTDDLSKLATMEQKYIKKYKQKYNLVNSVEYKPNRFWVSNEDKPYENAYESYGDIDIDKEEEEEEIIKKATSTSSKGLTNETFATKIFTQITGMVVFPAACKVEAMSSIEALRSEYDTTEKMVSYLAPFWKEWKGREYRKTNLAWLTDWAVSGEIPSAKNAVTDKKKEFEAEMKRRGLQPMEEARQ